jgi:hypothetical protein
LDVELAAFAVRSRSAWRRSKTDVKRLVSGVAAIFARIGFRSTYAMHASTADSSKSG